MKSGRNICQQGAMKTFFFLSTIVVVVEYTYGYCYIHPIEGSHCTAPNGVTIPAGSDIQIPERCEKCSCISFASDANKLHLSCCGYGKNAGVLMPPEGCKIITGEDGCSVKLVMISDETKHC